MKLTLLEMVQDILSSMDSDEVNSISDTAESLQVAKIIRDSYIELTDRLEAEEQYSLVELEATSSSTPTRLNLPEDVEKVVWIKYNNLIAADPTSYANYVDVTPLDLKSFLDMIYQFDKEATYFGTYNSDFGYGNIDTFYYNDRHPKYYTQVQDRYVIFDSYNLDEETHLQASRSLAYAKIIPSFTFSDSFTPRLDSNQFGLLLNESKRQAFIELKQSPNIVAEQRSKRGWVRTQHNLENIPVLKTKDRYPNYGRK